MTNSANQLLETLTHWVEQGWLRRLDRAFSAFLLELDPQAKPELLFCASLLAHLEGQGHSCLSIDQLLADPATTLAWPQEAMTAQHELMAQWPIDAIHWRDALTTSPLLADGGPLVLHSPRPTQIGKLYLRRYWNYERSVSNQILRRTTSPTTVQEEPVQQWLNLLFGESTQANFDWQRFACATALRANLSIITGGPGTGKTYTAARLLALLLALDTQPQGLRVALAAPTGKAAARLKQAIELSLLELESKLGDRLPLRELADAIGPARTLHALLGARLDTRKMRFDSSNPLEIDVLIVDEASMIHLEMMAALLDALPGHARLILLGDKDQLASVEAGAVLGELCQDAQTGQYNAASARYAMATTGQPLPTEFVTSTNNALAQQIVMLRHSRRFSGAIGQLAAAVNAGQVDLALHLLNQGDQQQVMAQMPALASNVVRLAIDGRRHAEVGYRHYLELVKRGPKDSSSEQHQLWVVAVLKAFERSRVLCAIHEGEFGSLGLNAAIESALHHAGLILKRGEWYNGRPVLITQNNYDVGVFNGDIGLALRDHDSATLRVYFLDGETARSVSLSRLNHLTTAYAMTVHKAQGSEFEHTVLVLPDLGSRALTRELVYTGITRARETFTLMAGDAGNFAAALARRTQRASGLRDNLALAAISSSVTS